MTLKEILEDAWKNSPCHCPLGPAHWGWLDSWNVKRILYCTNSAWTWATK